MKKNEREHLAALFKTLSSPIRLTMLSHMATCNNDNHKHNISELAKLCEVDFSVVSRHLKELKEANILIATKNKNDVLYQISSKQLISKLNVFIATLS